MAYAAYDFMSSRHRGEQWTSPETSEASLDSFTAVEWRVIALARNEKLANLKSPSRLGRALGLMLGIVPANALADPRLEVLRRAAIAMWHGRPAISQRWKERLLFGGYTNSQISMLDAYIADTKAG